MKRQYEKHFCDFKNEAECEEELEEVGVKMEREEEFFGE